MENFILDEFFLNTCVLCTGLFLTHQFYRKYSVSTDSSLQKKIIAGILQGLFGSLLMRYGIHLENGVLVDLRSIPIMLAAQVGGLWSSLISTIFIIIVRLLFYPLSLSSLLNIFVLLGAGIAFGIITRLQLRRITQWALMTLTFILLIGATIGIVIKNPRSMTEVFIQYSLSVVCSSYLTQFVQSILIKGDDKLEKLYEMAQTDFLTGLHNARSFDQEINQVFQKSKSKNEPLSLITLDIDHFKQINDKYGHPVGDEVLRQVSDLLVGNCRSIDFVSRIGGEEFSIILPACDVDIAQTVAERIRTAVENNQFIIHEDLELVVTVSVGLFTVTNYEHIEVSQLINHADEGLYVAKNTGRNRIFLYSPA